MILTVPSPLVERPELARLTVLRGLAALWVGVHNDVFFRERLGVDAYTAIAEKGYLAVDFFLVLSGFVLAYCYGPSLKHANWASYREFILKRFARIYPLFLFLIVVRVGLELVRLSIGRSDIFMGSTSIEALFANLFLVQAWGFIDHPTWLQSGWTVSAEWFAYLLFPLLLWLPKQFLYSKAGSLTAACLSLLLLFTSHSFFGTLEFPMHLSLLRCLPEFVIGLALGLVWQPLAESMASSSRICVVALASVVLVVSAHFGWPDPISFLSLVLILFALAKSDAKQQARSFLYRSGIWLGTISYSVYLCHQLVQAAWRKLHLIALPTSASQPLEIASLFLQWIAILILGQLLYWIVEKPARRLLRRRFLSTPPEVRQNSV